MIDLIATLRRMAAAGASADVLIAAVELAIQPDVERRAKDAIRQRAYRDRVRGRHVTSRFVTGQSRDTNVHVLEEERKKVSKKKTSKHPIAADWKLSEEDRAFARVKGWQESRINAEGERFRLYHVAKGDLVANEHACWCKWVISPYQGGVKTNGQRNPIMAACDELLAQCEDSERTRGDRAKDITPRSNQSGNATDLFLAARKAE